MSIRLRILGVLAAIPAIAALSGGLASAAPEDVVSADPEVVQNAARGFGSADMDRDAQGDPFIHGRIEGLKYSILFYGCTNNRDCRTIQLAASWEGMNVPPDVVNAWNVQKLFGKAALAADGSLSLSLPINLNRGVTRANLEDHFELWTSILAEFRREVVNAKAATR